MKSKLRTYNDYRTTRVVNALSKEVLTETSTLSFEHVAQGLQWALVRASDRSATSTVVEQGVNRLLKHALLVSDDDIWSIELKKSLKTVISVNYTTIEIVQI
jgi:hypothetical protein